MTSVKVLHGDSRETLLQIPDDSVDMCVTSPPYWNQRIYGKQEKQIGQEKTPQEYIQALGCVFNQVLRCLVDGGSLWVNIADVYAREGGNRVGSDRHTDGRRISEQYKLEVMDARVQVMARDIGRRPKSLIGIPSMLALAMVDSGWVWRSTVIWRKTNPMPETGMSRPNKSIEYIYQFCKSENNFWAGGPVMDVWDMAVATQIGHTAPFPEKLPKLCIQHTCPDGGTVLDCFGGSGTTGKVAVELGRNAILCELNDEYLTVIKARTNTTPGLGL